MEPLKLLHQETIQESSVDINTLPDDIKTQLTTLTSKIEAYEKEPEEAEKKKIETLSGKIAHKIKDHLEAALPDDTGTPVIVAEPALTHLAAIAQVDVATLSDDIKADIQALENSLEAFKKTPTEEERIVLEAFSNSIAEKVNAHVVQLAAQLAEEETKRLAEEEFERNNPQRTMVERNRRRRAEAVK